MIFSKLYSLELKSPELFIVSSGGIDVIEAFHCDGTAVSKYLAGLIKS